MKPYSLFIINSDTASLNVLHQSFLRSEAFELIGATCNPHDAIRDIRQKAPNIVLTDMILRGIDICQLLRGLSAMKPRPLVIVYTEFITSFSLDLARRSGVDYFIFKPTEFSSLENTLINAAENYTEKLNFQSRHAEPTEERLLSILLGHMRQLRFSPNYLGSQYIADAVLLLTKNPSLLRNLSARLYPELASRLHVTSAQIERCIRTSIMAANSTGQLIRLLGAPPTNKSCIRYLMQFLNSKIDDQQTCILPRDMLR